MLKIVEGRFRNSFPEFFDLIFRARYETFVLGRQWSLPVQFHRGDREVDQYDNDDAVYFADFDETGHLQGSLRLTPTVTSSLTADYFPHLCETAAIPRDPFVYEGTRYIVNPRVRTTANNRIAKARILAAMTEWAWSIGLLHIQSVIDASLFRPFKELNSEVIALGRIHPYGGGKEVKGGGTCIAIRLPVTEKSIAEVRAYGGLEPWSGPEHGILFNGGVGGGLKRVA
jgi:acyl-homoserine lactone synthase